MNIIVIGIDCATEAQKTGLSLGIYENNEMILKESLIGSKSNSIAEIVNAWININFKVLLAMDAPLGWPVHLGETLYSHNAGGPIDTVESNMIFRRETDRFIKKKLGKQSLDVGADRIARTAYSALKIINEVRALTKKIINLTWDSKELNDISVIEVYPAATLGSYGILSEGYKDKTQTSARREIVNCISKHIKIENEFKILENNADALDSAVCLLAAKDFLKGNVYCPENIDLAKKEGWIWVKEK